VNEVALKEVLWNLNSNALNLHAFENMFVI
jgi:hypothetical protein